MSVLLLAESVEDPWIDTDLLLRIVRETDTPDMGIFDAVTQVLAAFNYVSALMAGKGALERVIQVELTDEMYEGVMQDPLCNGLALIFDAMVNEARKQRLELLVGTGRMLTVEQMRALGVHCNACAFINILKELHGLRDIQAMVYGLNGDGGHGDGSVE
jgi:hypothetical protein